ncbi:MAG: HEPN domain-containing protein [Candidatus Omnitrophica bacterium]|nr:HEPN domain-containing protein [Candidatus Omnitrophota bacterium]
MLETLLKKFIQQGKIRKQPAGFVQVEAFFKEALIDLDEAKKTLQVSKRGAYLLAYNSMLKCGRGLILLEGYVPDDGGQHKTVIDVCGLILGEEFKITMRKFDIMRRKRNDLTYEAGVPLSSKDAESALEEAGMLIAGIFKKVKSHNPQFELQL